MGINVEMLLASIRGGFQFRQHGEWVGPDQSYAKAEREGMAIQRMRSYLMRTPFVGATSK